LFTVDVNAKGKLFYSVAGPDEVTAFKSLEAGDQNCMLIYEDVEVLRSDTPATPVLLGLDPQFRRHRNV
jgi:hypothetical protein